MKTERGEERGREGGKGEGGREKGTREGKRGRERERERINSQAALLHWILHTCCAWADVMPSDTRRKGLYLVLCAVASSPVTLGQLCPS